MQSRHDAPKEHDQIVVYVMIEVADLREGKKAVIINC